MSLLLHEFEKLSAKEYSKGDFLLNEKFTFEIGSGNKIPLWLS